MSTHVNPLDCVQLFSHHFTRTWWALRGHVTPTRTNVSKKEDGGCFAQKPAAEFIAKSVSHSYKVGYYAHASEY